MFGFGRRDRLAAHRGASTALALRWLCRNGDAHWAERARRTFPAFVTLLLANFVLPAIAGFAAYERTGPWSRVSPAANGLIGAAAALVCCNATLLRFERRRFPAAKLTARAWIRGRATLLLVFAPRHLVAASSMIAAEQIPRPWSTVVRCAGVVGVIFAGGLGIALALRMHLRRTAVESLTASAARPDEGGPVQRRTSYGSHAKGRARMLWIVI